MPTTFSKADPESKKFLAGVIKKYHPELAKCELKICLMFARAARNEKGEIICPALKLHGVECAAIAKIIPYKQRAAGADDCRIDVDEDKWKEMTEDQRTSLLDHESTHFELQYDDEGHIKCDDCGRPKVKTRPHDADFGWFHSIASKHGDSSYEVQQAKAFADEHGQLYWGWSSPPGGGIEGVRAK